METTLWAGLIGGVVAVSRLVETNYGDLVTDAFCDAGETFMETAGGEDGGDIEGDIEDRRCYT